VNDCIDSLLVHSANIAMRYLADREDVRDVAQESVTMFLTQAGDDAINTIVYRLTQRRHREIKDEVVMKETLREIREPTEHSDEAEQQLRECMELLSPREQQVIYDVFWSGKGRKEIADRINMKCKTLDKVKERSLKNLKCRLEDIGVTEGNWKEWWYA
jgi:RNA polymerase sigma factor (sigma-70 family)